MKTEHTDNDGAVPTRKPGYYWVRQELGSWRMARWFQKEWIVPGTFNSFGDDYWLEIDETPITRPSAPTRKPINHELETAANVYAHDHGSPVAAYASALHKAFMAGASFVESRPSAPDKGETQEEMWNEVGFVVHEIHYDDAPSAINELMKRFTIARKPQPPTA